MGSMQKILNKKWYGLFVLVVLFRAISYWIVAHRAHPEALMSSLAMYREKGLDMTYFPFLSALANYGLHEGSVKEFAGQGILSFPIASVALHSLLFKWGGLFGFILADVACGLLFYFAFAFLLRTFGLSSLMSRLMSLLVVSTAMNKIGGLTKVIFETPSTFFQFILPALMVAVMIWQLFRLRKDSASTFTKDIVVKSLVAFVVLTGLVASTVFWYWTWRFPRPFITQSFYFLCLAILLGLLTEFKRFSALKFWVLLGFIFSLLVQGSIYQAIDICMIAVGVYAWILIKTPENKSGLLKGSLVAGLVTIVTSIPFLIQRFYESPEIPRRFGVYAVSRLHPFFLIPENNEWIYLAGLVAFGCLGWKIFTDEKHRKGVFFIGLILLSGLFAMPLNCVVLGKAIQVGHYWYDYLETLSICGILLILLFLAELPALFPLIRSSSRPRSRFVVMTALVLFCLAASFLDARKSTKVTGAVRSDFPEWGTLSTYRHDFDDLLQELGKPDYQKTEVIASFDVQILSWWTTFRQGHVFNPDVFQSLISDNEIEERLIHLGHLFNLSSSQFIEFLQRPYVNIFFLAHCKYQASQATTFAPLSDYTEEEQQFIREKTSIYSTFHVVLPGSEKKRIAQKFEETTLQNESPRQLDMIILTNDESVASFTPEKEKFQLVYHNPTFRVWKKL